ncbi:MAG: hypothetical protein J2P13_11590 [Acidobacteria bacterium]|nr:hypothetical protein [Acidobacteriota bacterium]
MKPATIAPNFGALPDELKVLPIWLVWEYRLKDREWSKVPLIADGSGRFAKTNDPKTWRTYAEALKHVRDGIGLRFVEPYCGVDLDLCRDPKTGAIADWAMKIVRFFNSYTEISPSGEGLHVIFKLGEPLPSGTRKRGAKDKGWEIGLYDATSPRYFCCTGCTLESHGRIQ